MKSTDEILVQCDCCKNWTYDIEFNGRVWICDLCWDDYHLSEECNHG